jgi:hypothetical protein
MPILNSSQPYINSDLHNDGCTVSNFVPKLLAMLKPFSLSCSFASSWPEYGKDEPSKYVLSVQVKPADILVINLHQNSRDRIKRNGVLKIVIIMRVRFVCYQSCRLVFRRSTVQIWTGDSIQIEMIMHFLSPQMNASTVNFIQPASISFQILVYHLIQYFPIFFPLRKP